MDALAEQSSPSVEPITINKITEKNLLPFSVGCEEEFFLFDSNGSLDHKLFLNHAAKNNINASLEMYECLVETNTTIHASIPSLNADIAKSREWIASFANINNLNFYAGGTHPHLKFSELKRTRSLYMDNVFEHYGYGINRVLCAGMHIHIGLSDQEELCKLHNALIPMLPLLLALSANSTHFCGIETNNKSYRTALMSALPRTGIPEEIHDMNTYLSNIIRLVDAGILDKPSSIYYDMRLHHVYKTIELRVMDAQKTPEDSQAIIAFTLALAKYLLDGIRNDMLTPEAPLFITRENRWQAAKFGTQGIFTLTGQETKQSFSEFALALISSTSMSKTLSDASMLEKTAEFIIRKTRDDR